MRRIIITGATGMIGINLIKYLLKKDVEVIAIIRKNSKKRKMIPNSDKLKIIECNLDEINQLDLPIKDCDICFHLAWDGTLGSSRDDVYRQSLNIKYTLDVVNFAKKLGCKKIIGAGSQAEYGRIEGKISSKTPTNPVTAYGSAKLCAGELSRVFAEQLDIEHVWTRILSVYGPYDDENTMIMSSIKEMIHQHESPEYTKAEQMWDYLYVEDVVRALYLIAEKGKNNSIYCIGSGKQEPLYSYIEEIRNQIDEKIELKLGAKEYSKNQVMSLCADISVLTKDTGFIPKIDFKEGIKRTINWYKRGEKNEEN